jgi:GTP cyclohydrolase II
MSTLENRSRAAAQVGALWRIASTRLPTEWGMFEAIGFERDLWTAGARTAETALALVLGDLRQGVPLVRIHSQCMTGEVFGCVATAADSSSSPCKQSYRKVGGW